jgi:hypothetical protein
LARSLQKQDQHQAKAGLIDIVIQVADNGVRHAMNYPLMRGVTPFFLTDTQE